MRKWLSISLRCLFLASLLRGEDRGEPAYDKDWGLCNGDLSVRGFSKTCSVHAPRLLALLWWEGSQAGEGKSNFGVLSLGQGRCGRADAGFLAAAGAPGVHRGLYVRAGGYQGARMTKARSSRLSGGKEPISPRHPRLLAVSGSLEPPTVMEKKMKTHPVVPDGNPPACQGSALRCVFVFRGTSGSPGGLGCRRASPAAWPRPPAAGGRSCAGPGPFPVGFHGSSLSWKQFVSVVNRLRNSGVSDTSVGCGKTMKLL